MILRTIFDVCVSKLLPSTLILMSLHQNALSTSSITTSKSSSNLLKVWIFFYLKPLKPLKPDDVWFQASRNTLATFVSQMCEHAGKKTNHSSRDSGASAMFNAEVQQKMIKSVTGHKSSKALAIYERPTLQQQQAVSGVLILKLLEQRSQQQSAVASKCS